jgi:septal ring factor EnvC (AmiA/AmiB activator)
MKQKISNHKKLQLLLWGTLIVVLTCYLTVFQKTIKERKILNENRNLTTKISNAGQIKENLLSELTKLESEIKSGSTNEVNQQEKLLEIVNRTFPGVGIRIIEMSKQEIAEEANYSIINQAIVLQGKFFELLLLVREIENEEGLGHICSSDFYRYTDKKSGLSFTRLKLYLEELIPHK